MVTPPNRELTMNVNHVATAASQKKIYRSIQEAIDAKDSKAIRAFLNRAYQDKTDIIIDARSAKK
jgi:predicted lipid-binding transport protein (Tim44 family)